VNRRRLVLFVLISVALHLALIGAVEYGPRQPLPVDAETMPQPTLEFEMVQQQGAGKPAAPASPKPGQPADSNQAPPPPPQPEQPKPPPEAPAEEALPLPPPPAPATPAESKPAAAASPPPGTPAESKPAAAASPPPGTPSPAPKPDTAPEVNLGGTDSLSNLLAVGPQIIPPGIDSKYRNREPVYPRAAAERGQEGAVTLLIHVAPDGHGESVEIQQSSGYRVLDQAAYDAVITWHFHAAIKNGEVVSSELPVRIQFTLD
jgi:protein TonB